MKTKVTPVILGESLIDIVEGNDYPGGSPANVAIALGRLGYKPQLVTTIANDLHGTLLRDWLRESNVEPIASVPLNRKTSTAHVTFDSKRVPQYNFDITWDLPSEIALRAVAHAKVVHSGSIATVLPPGADAVQSAIESVQGQALITFDPNARPAITPDREPVVARVSAFAQLADVVKVSEEDLAWYFPGSAGPAMSAANWFTEDRIGGPGLIIVTLGKDGAMFLRPGKKPIKVPGLAIKLEDTVGAGDTFMGAVIDSLIRQGVTGGSARSRLLSLDDYSIINIVRSGVIASAINCQRAGANPPTRLEIDQFLKSPITSAN